MADRAEAQRRADRIAAFRRELDALTRAGVARLTDEQQQAIDAYHAGLLQALAREHDVDRSAAAGQLSRGMRVASFFAAVTLTAAIYSLVAQFWGSLDLPMQATLLCAFPLAALVGVELSAQRERTLYVASIFALVAYGTCWLAIGELSRRLGVPVTPPAVWAAALFGIGLAMPYRFRLVFGLALVNLLVALGGSIFRLAGVAWTAVLEYPDLLAAMALMMTLLARAALFDQAFASVTRLVGFGVGLLALLILSSVGQVSLLTSAPHVSELIYQAITLVVAVVALVLALRCGWHETVYVTAVALTLFVFIRFVDWFWASLPRYVFFFALAGVAFGWLLVLRRIRAGLRQEAA